MTVFTILCYACVVVKYAIGCIYGWLGNAAKMERRRQEKTRYDLFMEDPDCIYMLSLVDIMKKVPVHLKMQVKMNIMKALSDGTEFRKSSEDSAEPSADNATEPLANDVTDTCARDATDTSAGVVVPSEEEIDAIRDVAGTAVQLAAISTTASSIEPSRPSERDAAETSEAVNANSVPLGRAENAEPRADDSADEPPLTVQEEVRRVFLSIDRNNIENKCKEIKKIVSRKYLPWLARFFVTGVKTESKNHSMYYACLERFSSVPFEKHVVSETIETINALLKSDTRSSQTIVSLKHLGYWLGIITLVRGKPVPLNLEWLLGGAQFRGHDELSFVIPLVTKILMSCDRSQGYGPKTPWTLSVLKRLNQIYVRSSLNSELLADIKNLYDTLDVDPKDLRPQNRTNKQRITETIRYYM